MQILIFSNPWTQQVKHEHGIVEPSGVQALKNPNPLKDVEGLDVLVVAELSQLGSGVV